MSLDGERAPGSHAAHAERARTTDPISTRDAIAEARAKRNANANQTREVEPIDAAAAVFHSAFDWHRRYVFQGAPITTGWEMEGTSPRILNFYRPAGFTDEAWLALTLPARKKAISTSVHSGYEGLVKLAGTPDFLPAILKVDMGGWEIASEKPATTPAEHFAQVEWARTHIERTGSFHHTITFDQPKGNAPTVDALLGGIALANEYNALKNLEGERVATAFTSPRTELVDALIAPYEADDYDDIRRALLAGSPADHKLTTVAIRAFEYGEGRLGIEIRGANNDDERAKRTYANMLTVLEQGGDATLKLGSSGHPYKLASLLKGKGPERLSQAAIERMQMAVDQQLKAEGRSPQSLSHFLDFYAVRRLALAYLPWEQRANVPKHLHAGIAQARDALTVELAEVAYLNDGRPDRSLDSHGDPNEPVSKAELAFQRFVQRSKVAETF